MQNFDFQIIYRKGSDITHVDYLNKNPIEITNQIDSASINFQNWLTLEQSRDSECKQIIKALETDDATKHKFEIDKFTLFHIVTDKNSNKTTQLIFVPLNNRHNLARNPITGGPDGSSGTKTAQHGDHRRTSHDHQLLQQQLADAQRLLTEHRANQNPPDTAQGNSPAGTPRTEEEETNSTPKLPPFWHKNPSLWFVQDRRQKCIGNGRLSKKSTFPKRSVDLRAQSNIKYPHRKSRKWKNSCLSEMHTACGENGDFKK
ncbi:hypothetical protein TcasGA2_TC010695 [Tribolium castaneum]|uniref:Uncharacterized protein n=1 Tax=Tribolium castaneum TaxID=7070 RepID=D2CG34_TRICA|nr:hypothetical protein TcasGA2_TC010695 [Tribolium castaneum]